MSRTYRLSEQAGAHVDAIADFIAGDSVDAAVKVVLALEDAFVLLAARPGIGHVREDLVSVSHTSPVEAKSACVRIPASPAFTSRANAWVQRRMIPAQNVHRG